MGKTKQYWQDQEDLKHMYDFNLQADLMKRVENAIAAKQTKKAQDPVGRDLLTNPLYKPKKVPNRKKHHKLKELKDA